MNIKTWHTIGIEQRKEYVKSLSDEAFQVHLVNLHSMLAEVVMLLDLAKQVGSQRAVTLAQDELDLNISIIEFFVNNRA